MKFAIVIPDGCADEPQEALSGKTPLQAAKTPHMDRIARTGFVGRSNNVPAALTPASDVATLSLFGYDPLNVYTGRAPLEAAAMGIALGPNDWAVRCNLVYVEQGEMRDFTAGHIDSADARELIASVATNLGGPFALSGSPAVTGQLDFFPGVSYRNLLICRCNSPSLFNEQTKTQPPHDIPDKPVADHLPCGPGSSLLRSLMEQSRPLLDQHPINVKRRSRGKPSATQIWLWGQGRAPQLESFSSRFGHTGAIISAVDLVRGVGILLGWDRIDVAGATGYLDTDYAAKGRAGVTALCDHDVVCVHVEAPDEASHEGRADAKVRALEEIDRHVVGPLLEGLATYGEWRMLVSPDHRTTLRTRAHAHGAVPFAVAGTGIKAGAATSYDELAGAAADIAFEEGHQLMRCFLNQASWPINRPANR